MNIQETKKYVKLFYVVILTTIAYNSLIEHYFGWKRVYETNLSIEVSVNFSSISFESFQAHLIELYLPKNTHTQNMVP